MATKRKPQKKVIVDGLDVFRKEGREEGECEGEREGRREGRREGGVRMVLRQLAARFGPVPAATKARVRAADQATLWRWALRLLTAKTLEAVLDGATRKAAKTATSAHKTARASRA